MEPASLCHEAQLTKFEISNLKIKQLAKATDKIGYTFFESFFIRDCDFSWAQLFKNLKLQYKFTLQVTIKKLMSFVTWQTTGFSESLNQSGREDG